MSRLESLRGHRHRLNLEALETRDLLAATPVLAGTTLTITGSENHDRIEVQFDAPVNQLVVLDAGRAVQRFNSAAVNNIVVNGLGGNDFILIGQGVPQAVTVNGGNGSSFFGNTGGDLIINRGTGPAVLNGNEGDDRLVGGPNSDALNGNAGRDVLQGLGGINVLTGGANRDFFFGVNGFDTITDFGPDDINRFVNLPQSAINDEFFTLPQSPQVTLTAPEVDILLQRATAATPSQDAIIVIVDRGGRILGVRAEAGVAPEVMNNALTRVFAIDGAVALARTAAYFGNNQSPLTSRTVQTLSETTLSQREIESNPNITDINSTLRGPGFVGPLGINSHFPRGVQYTPQVDLFAIEHTNRDSLFAIGPDNVKGANNGATTGDDKLLMQRFNVNPAFIPDRIKTPGATGDPLGRATVLAPPESYGVASGLLPGAQGRGLGTLPGGIPIFKKDPVTGQLVEVGGIGVFFPGKTGFATEENSALNTNFNPNLPDRSLEAEVIAFAALGGSSAANLRIGALGGVDALPNIDLPAGRIDLVGITLDVFGPKGLNGPQILIDHAKKLGTGTVNGTLQPLLNPGADNLINGVGDALQPNSLLNGTIVPEGLIVQPHAAADGSLSAADVRLQLFQGVQEALKTRAAIRLPMDSAASMVITVTSKTGEVLGQFRMPDSTVFSIDVATAKARNASYYADTTALQPIDQVPGVPAGVAFTARTFRYLALPRFPEGIDGNVPAPFSQLNDDPGIDRTTQVLVFPTLPQQLFIDTVGTGLQVGPAAPARQFQSVLGFNSFNPGTNFHDFRDTGIYVGPGAFQNNLLNRNGVVFFPGSSPVYQGPVLAGGLGISGDGVDQDDVVTVAARAGFDVPEALRADNFFFQGVRLPFHKFNRQPNINPYGSPSLGNTQIS